MDIVPPTDKRFFEIAEIPIQNQLKVSEKLVLVYKENDNQISLQEALPKDFYEKMSPEQILNVEFGIRNCGRVLICDEQGLGKRLQALALAYLYKGKWPLLIISPRPIMDHWKLKVKSLIVELNNSDIQVIKKNQDILCKEKKVIIITYKLLLKKIDELGEVQVTIVDQAHNLKSGTSQQNIQLVPFLESRRHVILLAEQALTKPMQIFNLLRIIRPDVFNSFIRFAKQYCDRKPNIIRKRYDYNGSSNEQELHSIITQSMMIKQQRKNVLELPGKKRLQINIDIDESLVEDFQHLNLKQDKSINGDEEDNFFLPKRDQVTQLYQEIFNEIGFPPQLIDYQSMMQQYFQKTCEAKVNGVCGYLDDFLGVNLLQEASSQKIIVFAFHTLMLKNIEKLFIQKEYSYIRINSKDSLKQRQKHAKEFYNDQGVSKYRIALVQLSAAQGLDLTAASTVIFAELHWSPWVLKQAEDSVYRTGQKNEVTFIQLIGDKTLDNRQLEILEVKQNTISLILDGEIKQQYTSNDKKNLKPQMSTGKYGEELKPQQEETNDDDKSNKKIPNNAKISQKIQDKKQLTPICHNPFSLERESLNQIQEITLEPILEKRVKLQQQTPQLYCEKPQLSFKNMEIQIQNNCTGGTQTSEMGIEDILSFYKYQSQDLNKPNAGYCPSRLTQGEPFTQVQESNNQQK